jgi:hypothetical protein
MGLSSAETVVIPGQPGLVWLGSAPTRGVSRGRRLENDQLAGRLKICGKYRVDCRRPLRPGGLFASCVYSNNSCDRSPRLQSPMNWPEYFTEQFMQP